LPNDTTYANKAVLPSISVQVLDKKEFEYEQLNDKRRELTKNILLKADEMGW